jgi:hypothetical protein
VQPVITHETMVTAAMRTIHTVRAPR